MRPADPSIDLQFFESLNHDKQLLHLVLFGLIAPSSHNTQPWLFEIKDGLIEVYENPKRRLPHSDPLSREFYLSIGAAIENIIESANAFGLGVAVDLFDPRSNTGKCAEIKIKTSTEDYNRAWLSAIVDRHSNRFEYEDKMPDREFLDWLDLQQSQDLKIFTITKPDQKRQTVELVGSALEMALDDSEFRKELSVWIKPSPQKFEDGMPGYNLGMPFLFSLIFPKLLKVFKFGKFQRKMDTKALFKTPVFVFLATKNDDILGWLQSGMLFEKIAIKAQMQRLNIGIQAAPIEMGDYYKQIQNLLVTDFRPVMFFRLGYSNQVPPKSPRLSLDKILVN